MTPQQVKGSYAKALRNHVTVRRYTGSGSPRPKLDIPNVRARVMNYLPRELVGTIIQGDQRAIVYFDDVVAGGISMLTINDKIIENGREMAILGVDVSTIKVDDIIIAYKLQLRG